VVAAGSHRAIAGARRWSCGAVHGRAGGRLDALEGSGRRENSGRAR
jgi:hypothetical protein